MFNESKLMCRLARTFAAGIQKAGDKKFTRPLVITSEI